MSKVYSEGTQQEVYPRVYWKINPKGMRQDIPPPECHDQEGQDAQEAQV